MRNGKRVARTVVVLALLATTRPAGAADPIVSDPAGDAQPDACGSVAWSCQWFGGESQPAADIVALRAGQSNGTFFLEIEYVDIDRPIRRLTDADRITDHVGFRLGNILDPQWASVDTFANRNFSGALLASDTAFYVTGRDGNRQAVPGKATVDRTTNRLRFSVSTAALTRAVQDTCAGCASFTRGAVLWSFSGNSRAVSAVEGAGTSVGAWTAASDTAWPGEGSYTLL